MICLLLTSISISFVNSLPEMGSMPFSKMYFSMSRRSKIDPDTGDTTGCSGTSLETENKEDVNNKIYLEISSLKVHKWQKVSFAA